MKYQYKEIKSYGLCYNLLVKKYKDTPRRYSPP